MADQIAQPYYQNQERYEPLSFIIQTAVQRTYHQLMIMIDMFPEIPDKERKIKIIAFACKTRQLFMRIYALVKFIKTAHINVSNILSFLDQQSFIFVDTADFLYHLARVKLVNARLPSFSILTSVDVLTLGTYPRLPSCVKDRILPAEKITEEDKLKALETLNRIIQCRLALSELPPQLKNFKIENGFVKFEVKNEFQVKLTLLSDNFKLPWRLLKLNILVKDAQDPNRCLVHNLQINYIHEILQMRLNENNKPLVDLYQSLHFFCQSLQLEILFDQMNSLNRLTMGRFYKITEYVNWKKLTLKYWLEYSTKNQYDFKFSLCVAENSDYLQTIHYPPLHWRDHKNIDLIFKTDDLLIEKVVYQIIKFRSKKRLLELQNIFENIDYCKCSLIDDKPALKIIFYISNFKNETLWIMIDYYTGLFQCLFPHSSLNYNLKQSIESCINSDLKKIEPILLNLRIWLLLRRCETIIQSYGFKCHEELHIISFSNQELSNLYSKLEKNRIFIELKKQEKIYIMVTIRTKEEINQSKEEINWYENVDLLENENSLSFNYYILKISKCRHDGELDPNKPFLKLISLSHFKRDSVHQTAQIKSIKKSLTFTPPKFEQTFVKDNCLINFLNMVYFIEERLPYLSFMKILNRKNIVTQNISSNPEILPLLNLNLISLPHFNQNDFNDYLHLEKISKELSNSLVSFTIRQKQFKDYLNTGLPFQSFTPFVKMTQFGFLSKFIFSIEFTFNNDLLKLEYDPSNETKIDVYNCLIDSNNLDNFYTSIKLEWISMCRVYSLVKELQRAFVKYPDLVKQVKIKKVNFKKLVLKYGPNLAYIIQFQWSKETKQFDVLLDVDPKQTGFYINHHFIFINEIKKHFQTNQSVLNLIQILNYTSQSVLGLAKLLNLPKFYSKPYNQGLQPNCGFMLLINSLTHFKLFYYSKYCLDIHVKPNGLVSIRDASFCLTDINTGIEDLHPVQLLNSFLKLFQDENVQELLKRRSSLIDDDNPSSPIQQTNIQSTQQQHVFLPPTSPAVQPRSNLPAPSPIQNYYAQSPGLAAPTSNLPVQSPGFSNFGSPAIPQSSPSTNQQLITNPQSQQHPIQSPSGFMSPANASQAPFSNQSPANFSSELSLQSPLQQSIPIKSPFVGPSPYTFNRDANRDFPDDKLNNKTLNNHQYKKYHLGSIPIYLSEAGFLKMISINSEINSNLTPLELFLSSYHLKKILLKTIQNDLVSYQVKNQEQQIYKSYFLEFQIMSEINQMNYQSFSIQFFQTNHELLVDVIQKYFNSKIFQAPFRSSHIISFLNLISINDLKLLKEFVQMFDYELNPLYYKSQWRLKFCWSLPNGYQLKSQKSSFFLPIVQSSSNGFQKKLNNKYFFGLYLFNQQRVQSPNWLPFILLLICYDSSINNFQFDLFRPYNEIPAVYNAYDSYINNLVNSAKSKDMNFSLLSIINEIIYGLPSVLNMGS